MPKYKISCDGVEMVQDADDHYRAAEQAASACFWSTGYEYSRNEYRGVTVTHIDSGITKQFDVHGEPEMIFQATESQEDS